MSEEIKSVRLSKIIKEYNIALPTIVDFLAKKGIQIESNPNAKIDAPALNLIKKEFAKDKQTKEESLKFGARLKEQTNEKEEGRTNEVETPIDEEVVTIRTNSLPTKPTPQKETETKKVEVKVEEVGPKKETPKEEPTVVAPVSVEPKKEEPKKEEVKVSEEPKKEPEKKESSKEMPGKVKVVGKIDLEAPNKKHERDGKPQSSDGGKNQKNAQKPEKKEDKHPEKKVEAPKQETKVAVKTPEQKPAQNPEPKFIKTPEVKLQGVKVVDTIDLTKFERPKPTNDRPNGENKKKKRKRIEPGSRPNAQNGANAQNANQGGKNQGGKNQQGSKKDDRNKKKHQPVEEPVGYTAEEVNKKLSETIASQKQKGKSKSSVYRREKRHKASEEHEEEIRIREEEKKILKVTEFVTANELATMMNIPVTKVISTCMSLGILVSINQRLNAEVLAVVAEEFGFKVEFTSIEVQEAIAEQEEQENPEDLIPRVPIVTVMGHVDHGKTKLLDFIRHSNVVAGEAGGITQHIGAYEVTNAAGKKVTFLDTPGHEAFTAMRARGASVTDVAIIVIAADSKVMPQTIEAINHAQAANVPIVFAINKIDLPTANPQKIYEELSHMNILVEEWGGKYQSQEISAKSGLNVDKLLDKVLLEAEMLDLKGNPKRSAKGTVIESALDKGRGYIAKILVQDGTLRVGDIILAGTTMGKVKAMFNERNQPYKEAGPSTPVLLLGLNGAPQAGDSFVVMEDEKEAKNIVSRRQQLQREQGLRTQKHITLDEIGRRLAIGDFKELNIIVKGDVDGSVEALTDSLLKLSTEEVQVNVIHKAVGAISESDVSLASASDAVIVAFNVRPTAQARKLAEREQIDIRVYSIIYTAIEEIKAAIEGMLAPKIEEVVTCNIEIREVFNISKVGRIAGCQVLEGKVTRQTKIRVIRDGIVIHTGTLGSLKRFKDDVKEVSAGFECGLNIQDYNEIQVGDIIEGYVEKEVSRKL